MTILARVSAAACVSALTKAGFVVELENERGTALSRDGRIVLVPPATVLSEAALRLILFAARLSLDEFTRLLDRERLAMRASGVRNRIDIVDEQPLFSRPYVHDERAGKR